MLQSERALDDQLKALASGLDEAAPAPDGPTVRERPMSSASPSHRRGRYMLALAAAALVVIVGALVVSNADQGDVSAGPASEDAATDNAATEEAGPEEAGPEENLQEPPPSTTVGTEPPTTTEPRPTTVEQPTVEPYVTDGAPADLVLGSTRTGADLGEPASDLITHIYGLADKPEPEDGDPRLTVSISRGLDPPVDGTPIDVRGGEGVARPDGAIGFADGDLVVWVRSRTLDQATLVAIADQLVVNPDGVEPLNEAPLGLVFLGEVVSHLYDDFGSSVPADGHSTDYTNNDRSLSVMSGPAGPNARAILNWSTDAVVREVGERTVVIVESEPVEGSPSFTQALWLEGDTLVRVVAISLTPDEVVAAIEGTRPASAD